MTTEERQTIAESTAKYVRARLRDVHVGEGFRFDGPSDSIYEHRGDGWHSAGLNAGGLIHASPDSWVWVRSQSREQPEPRTAATKASTPIREFQIIDHGIDHPDYFQSCGTAFTAYADVATGIGANPAEAVDDALAKLARQGHAVSDMIPRILADLRRERLPTKPVARGGSRYYVSIRVK